MAYILHIETSTKVCSVALSENGKLIALKESEEDGYSHGENLTLFVEDVLKTAQLTLREIDAVSVASGPGSYTGLRIGVSTAKGICYPLGIPLIAIDSLTSLSELARIKHPSSTLCALIDARRMEVFSCIFSINAEQIKPISADVIEQNTYKQYEPYIFFGDGAEKLIEIWSKNNCKADLTIASSSTGQIKIAYEKFQKEQFEDVAYFEPYYLKDFVSTSKKVQN